MYGATLPSTRPGRPAADAPARVAIIMRTKDRSLLLARALASVLSQSLADWTLCLVNDGGVASSVEDAVAPFRHLLGGRLRILHNETSRGMEAASNQAIQASSAAYLVVHDDDDTWHPDFLAETVAFLDAEANARFCGVVTWSELVHERIEGGDIHTTSRQPNNCWYHQIELSRLLGSNIIPTNCFVFRREVVARVGLFDESLPVLGDWDFNIRCAMDSDIAVLPKVLAHYHQRAALRAGDAYGNSIYSGLHLHQTYNAKIRNDLLRRHLAGNEGRLGSAMAVSQGFVQINDRMNYLEHVLNRQDRNVATLLERSGADGLAELNERVQRLEHLIAAQPSVSGPEWEAMLDTARQVRAILRPARALWHRLLPLRRALARLRGRVR